MPATFSNAVSIVSAGFVLFLWRKFRNTNTANGLPLPPGPPGSYLLGNLFDIPKSEEWVTYRNWGSKYGSDVVHFSAFGMHTVVLNSARAAHELFEKRSALYSDRPSLTAFSYLDCDWHMPLMPYGALWRQHRRIFQEHFKSDVLASYERHLEGCVHAFLRTLAHNPLAFRENIRLLTAKTIVYMAYGLDVETHDDPFVEAAAEVVAAGNIAGGPNGLVYDIFPFLQRTPAWFPGTGFRRWAKKVGPKLTRATRDAPWEAMLDAKEQANRGSQHTISVAERMLERYGDDASLHDTLKAVAGIMYLGGADTTVSSLSSFFMAMMLYPDAQKKAHQELDNVLGGALPTLADRARLPYTNALFKEVFRWHPVTSLAVPHKLTSDDVYEGMFLPANSIVFGNVWAILHDPAVFPLPESFDPAHFISAQQGGTYPAEDCKDEEPPFPEVAFGFGRRICPGRELAKSSLWLTIASVLSEFDIGRVKDENGEYLQSKETWHFGLFSHPGPFACSITPRNEKARETVLGTSTDQ